MKSRAHQERNFEKLVFLSPEKSNCEVSKRNWWVFSDLGIKFSVKVTKLSIFSPLKGTIAPLALLGVPLPVIEGIFGRIRYSFKFIFLFFVSFSRVKNHLLDFKLTKIDKIQAVSLNLQRI